MTRTAITMTHGTTEFFTTPARCTEIVYGDRARGKVVFSAMLSPDDAPTRVVRREAYSRDEFYAHLCELARMKEFLSVSTR